MVALKVFLYSLLAAGGGGYLAYRVGFYLALKFLKGEYAEAFAMLIAIASAVIIGGCSAITAGVLAGRSVKKL